jgi:alginate O-acetyltransferase complex protein AlgJ
MKSFFIKKHSALLTSIFVPEMDDPSASVHSGLGTGTAAGQSPSAPSPFKYMEWMLISGMLLILFAPIAGKIMGWPQECDLKENRYLAHPPDVGKTSWDTLPNTVDQWWNDRFAFRTQLIPLRELIWLDLLSAPGKQYVRGIDGHLFLNPMPGEIFHGGQNSTVLDYLGINHLTAEQLSNWTDYLEGKSAWLLAHGIHYLFVIAPNKITVQERFLPNIIRMGKGMSYLEQLQEQVFPNLTPNVDLLDLTPVLIAKEHETGIPMFSRTGDVAHWNGYGFLEGLLAMDERLRRHFPDMSPFPEGKLELQQSGIDPTAYSCRWENDPAVHAVQEPIIAFRSDGWDDPKCSEVVGRKGKLVLFSDSSWKGFCAGLESFFPTAHTAFPYQWKHHRHADIYHLTFNELRRMIQEEEPDVVVEAQTERALVIPPEIGIPAEFRIAARFARGNTIFLLTINELDTLFGANIDGITIDGDALVINATNDDPALGISQSIQIAEGSEPIMLIDLDAPVSGIFQVFWSINDMFSENDSIKADLKTGRNVIFLPIPLPAGEEYRLRIDPGAVAGKYRIRKIEIHATPSL